VAHDPEGLTPPRATRSLSEPVRPRTLRTVLSASPRVPSPVLRLLLGLLGRVGGTGGVVLLAGCQCGSPPAVTVAERGVARPAPDRPDPAAQAVPPAAEPGPSGRAPAPDPRFQAPSWASPLGGPSTEEVPLGEDQDGADDERDLEAELTDAFGTPMDCFTPEVAAARRGRVEVGVTVYAVTVGRVTRAEVSAPGFPTAVVDCLERRAEGLRLDAPVPDAPRRIRTVVPYRFSGPTSPPEAAASDRDDGDEGPTLPPGAVAPGLTLPAQVGEGPAPGAVPAGSALPARVGEGPAPGAVPPALTLPARAEE